MAVVVVVVAAAATAAAGRPRWCSRLNRHFAPGENGRFDPGAIPKTTILAAALLSRPNPRFGEQVDPAGKRGENF